MIPLRVKLLIIAIILIAILVSILYTTNETILGSSNSLTGYYDEQEVAFMIKEVSENRGDVLGRMMRPSVVVNSSLKQMSTLGQMFVFVNGTFGGGPFGYQHSVLSPILSNEGNSSLMVVRKVSWRRATNEGSEIEQKVKPRELRSVNEIAKALGAAEITITETGVVVRVSIVRGDKG